MIMRLTKQTLLLLEILICTKFPTMVIIRTIIITLKRNDLWLLLGLLSHLSNEFSLYANNSYLIFIINTTVV